MKILRSIVALTVAAQMAMAGQASTLVLSQIFARWNKEEKKLYQSTANKFNELLASPDKLKKWIKRDAKISPKNRKLLNQDFALADKKRLSRSRVELKDGTYLLSVPGFKQLVLDLRTMPKGYIIIDGYRAALKRWPL